MQELRTRNSFTAGFGRYIGDRATEGHQGAEEEEEEKRTLELIRAKHSEKEDRVWHSQRGGNAMGPHQKQIEYEQPRKSVEYHT